MRKVMILPGAFSTLIVGLFRDQGYEIVHKLDDNLDLLVFAGGEDVDPFFYNHDTHRNTHSNYNKDIREIEQYQIAKELGIPCVGICRGGQLLHILNGGTMWQDVDLHGRDHIGRTFGTNIEVLLSSMHHQMMIPNKETENIILLVASESTKKERMGEMDSQVGHVPVVTTRYCNKDHPDDDIEALYYPETNCLCFQPHPELYMSSSKKERYKPMVDLFFSYIDQYCFDTEQETE